MQSVLLVKKPEVLQPRTPRTEEPPRAQPARAQTTGRRPRTRNAHTHDTRKSLTLRSTYSCIATLLRQLRRFFSVALPPGEEHASDCVPPATRQKVLSHRLVPSDRG